MGAAAWVAAAATALLALPGLAAETGLKSTAARATTAAASAAAPSATATTSPNAAAASAAKTTATTAANAAADAALAPSVLVDVNRYRGSLGLALLQDDPRLAALAAEHSAAMAQRGDMAHDGFAQRLARSGRARCVENLAADFQQAGAVLAAWQASAVHQANLVDAALRRVGVASVAGYITWLACD